MLLGTLRGSLLENMLAGKGIVRAGSENKKRKAIVELFMEKNGILNTALFYEKLRNTKILLK